MNVCFIGACGHTGQAYTVLKSREDVTLCGYAPGCDRESPVFPHDPSILCFSDWRAMLDRVKPDLAVVSPVFALTGQVILECARRKINVFAEKPVASSLEELAEVRRGVADSGIRFCAMHYLRYIPAFYHGAKLVREGCIGDPVMLTAQKSYKYGTRPAWYGERALYGGTIPWVGIHGVDWIHQFSGRRFLSAAAHALGRDPEMAALCMFELEGGVIAGVNLDYYRPAGASTHGDDRIRCVGTKGVLEVWAGRIYLADASGEEVITPEDAPELLTAFLAGEDCVSPEDIFAVTEAALAARDSADTGKTVDLS